MIFIGCKDPTIVSLDEESRCWIMREAYIHGIMDGEVLQVKHYIVDIDLY